MSASSCAGVSPYSTAWGGKPWPRGNTWHIITKGETTTDNFAKRIEPKEYQSLRHFLRTLERSGNRRGRLISEAIAKELTARQAEMVRMYFLEQHTMKQIAEELSVNPSTVSRTLSVARAKLRRCMRFGALRLLEEEDDEY